MLGSEDALALVRKLTDIGVALSAEKDSARLMELILRGAREITGADGGTLYTRGDDDTLAFAIMFTESLGIHVGGSSGRPAELPPVPLYAADGTPNHHMVAASAAITGRIINVADVYDTRGIEFAGTRAFDARTGYRSRALLTVPMRDHHDRVIGVLQLLNPTDPRSAEPRVFTAADEALVSSLASQAAVAMANQRLIADQKALFEAFIQLITGAIDDKSPYTGGHCRRVPELTMLLAEAACRSDRGDLAGFQMSEDDRYELHIAGWVHDCGKVTTPEYVVDKATKLQTIFDRIALVEGRFDVLRQAARVAHLRARAAAQDDAEVLAADRDHAATLARLDEELDFLRRCNIGGEFMSAADQQRVRDMGARSMLPGGAVATLLGAEEVRSLCISRGTLQVRIMGIADIFEALTAADRPYKQAMRLSEALGVLGRLKEEQHIDADLFDVFVRERVYLRYAEPFLDPEQIDHVDEQAIPGYTP